MKRHSRVTEKEEITEKMMVLGVPFPRGAGGDDPGGIFGGLVFLGVSVVKEGRS